MKKVLFTIFIWFIAINLMEKVEDLSSFIFSTIITILCFTISLIIWKVIPLCKITNHHVPYLYKGIYYCKYCNKPLNRKL